MNVRELNGFQPDEPITLTIGVFDGVHLGHQYLLREVVERARSAGRLAAVITFHPHPRLVLQPDMEPAYLTSIDERIRLIRALGIDRVATITFTRDLSQLGPAEFIDLVRRHLRLEELLIGHDFALGKDRAGDLPTLRRLGAERGFQVAEIPPFTLGGITINSTLIRRAVSTGDMATATRYLGRPFSLEGPVIDGDQRGRTIGFPTANQTLPPGLIVPATGIYVSLATIGGRTYGAVTNAGYRPTVNNRGYLVETFIFDFNEEIYGQTMRVELLHRIREEMKFSGLAELTAQIARDADFAREFLRNGGFQGVAAG